MGVILAPGPLELHAVPPLWLAWSIIVGFPLLVAGSVVSALRAPRKKS